MKAMHTICHHDGLRPANFRTVDIRQGVYGSGYWVLTPEEQTSLLGGWLYLHESSSVKSYFAGKISALGECIGDAVEIIVQKKGPQEVPWRGRKAGQNKRDNFRIVDAVYKHELGVA